METENRQYPRFESLNTVAYLCLDETDTVVSQGMGRTLNLSENGILLHAYRPIEGCDRILITIGLGEELVEIRGRLIHSRKDPSAGFHYGIEFVEPETADKATLLKFVSQFEGKGFNHGASCI